MSAKRNRKSKHTPGPALISKISDDPLSKLRTIFTNIRAPSFNKFKQMIEQEDPIAGGDIPTSILYYKCPFKKNAGWRGRISFFNDNPLIIYYIFVIGSLKVIGHRGNVGNLYNQPNGL